MAGGGTAPPLRMGDVLLLVGVSLLIATLFIQEWDIPTKVNAGDAPLEGTTRSFSGDVVDISVQTENESNVRIQIFEDDEEVFDENLFADSSTSAEATYESNGGVLSWKVILEDDVSGEIDVDLSRAYFLGYVPYLLGALLTTAGVMKKNADLGNKEDTIIDAIIEDED